MKHHLEVWISSWSSELQKREQFGLLQLLPRECCPSWVARMMIHIKTWELCKCSSSHPRPKHVAQHAWVTNAQYDKGTISWQYATPNYQHTLPYHLWNHVKTSKYLQRPGPEKTFPSLSNGPYRRSILFDSRTISASGLSVPQLTRLQILGCSFVPFGWSASPMCANPTTVKQPQDSPDVGDLRIRETELTYSSMV